MGGGKHKVFERVVSKGGKLGCQKQFLSLQYFFLNPLPFSQSILLSPRLSQTAILPKPFLSRQSVDSHPSCLDHPTRHSLRTHLRQPLAVLQTLAVPAAQ